MSKVNKLFLNNGKPVNCVTLENRVGMKVSLCDLGATLLSVWVPDSKGNLLDVVLGYADINDYLESNHAFFGATIGRNANRIEDARFQLGDECIQLDANEGMTSLHSGLNGYHTRIWEIKTVTDNSVTFRLDSPDGDQGFPGHLIMEAMYELGEDNKLRVTYRGLSDKDTIFNPTNHTYFNLNGQGSGDILKHILKMNCKAYTPIVDSRSIPTGDCSSVTNTPFDFTIEKTIGENIKSDFKQVRLAKGYDHNFCISKEKEHTDFALLKGDNSGIKMSVATNLPGVQLYSGNFLENIPGKIKSIYQKYSGVCLETQYFPNAINTPTFESPILKANETKEYVTVYSFSV